MRRSRVLVLGMLLLTARVWAAPDAATIVEQMKQALEPPRSSLRKVALTVRQGKETVTVHLGVALSSGGDGGRLLAVVLAPAELQGTAFLIKEERARPSDTTWMYVPTIRRVRSLVSPEAYSAFLNSDFAFSDLGFTSTRSAVTLEGEDTRAGVHVYRLSAVPAQNWYYSKVETTVAVDTHLPIERRYFDPAGGLWKVERWEHVVAINGIPTALSVTMEDVQAKSSSTIAVTDLAYDATVPPALLEPGNMPSAATSPVWGALQAPVGQ